MTRSHAVQPEKTQQQPRRLTKSEQARRAREYAAQLAALYGDAFTPSKYRRAIRAQGAR
jgi:hypothetical protein